MTISVSTLRATVGAQPSDDAALSLDLAQAAALVAQYVSGTVAAIPAEEPTTWSVITELDIPTVILDRALGEVAHDLFSRRRAPNGILTQQFDTPEGIGSQAIRINRDPMAPAYKILGRWVVPF